MEAWKEEIARARLIAEIDRHPLFALPDEERAQDKELFSGLCSLVLKAKG